MSADDTGPATHPGRVLSPTRATIVGALVGVALAALAVGALAVGPSDGGAAPAPQVEADAGADDHVEVDPETDEPVIDACVEIPEMCGDRVGGSDAPCDQGAMCGDVAPGPVAEGEEADIDAATGACEGELCGEIGPGVDDGTGP